MPVAVCPNCGYDARGLPTDVCPECGQRLPEVAPPAAPRLSWRIACAAVIIAATVAVAWFATFVPGYPQWWGPLPLTVVIPLFITENEILAFVPVIVTAALLSAPLVLGRVQAPWWTVIPILGITVVAWCHFAFGITYGLQYQGGAYVAMCGLIQGASTLTLVGLGAFSRRRRSFFLVVIWHLLVSIWLASYAFPYYGELP